MSISRHLDFLLVVLTNAGIFYPGNGAYVLRISRHSDFLLVVLTNAGIFLCCLNLCGESRTEQVLLVSKKKIGGNHAFFRDN